MFKHMEQVTRGDGGRHNLNDCTLISRIRYVDISEILIMLSLFNSRMFSMLSGYKNLGESRTLVQGSTTVIDPRALHGVPKSQALERSWRDKQYKTHGFLPGISMKDPGLSQYIVMVGKFSAISL